MKPAAPRRRPGADVSAMIRGQIVLRASDCDEEGLKHGDVGSQRSRCESSDLLIWSALKKIKRRLEKCVCF